MAISLRLLAPPSDEEILELSERNPGLQFEQTADGELIVTPTSSEAGRWEVELVVQLHRWATTDGSGIVFGPSAGFRLPDGSLRSPDASWVRRERWLALSPLQRRGFAPLCPDAVFEIASSADALTFLRGKMQTYLANGARLAVLIVPQERRIERYLPDREVQVSEAPTRFSLDPVLPGCRLDLEPIFGEEAGA